MRERYVLVGGMLLCGALYFYSATLEDAKSAAIAAWLQAVGGILAVIAAYNMGSAQVRAAARLQKEQASASAAQARAVVEAMAKVVDRQIRLIRAVGPQSTLVMTPDALVENLPVIDGTLSLHLSEDASQSLLDVRSAMVDLISVIRSQQGAFIHGHSRVVMVVDAAEVVCKLAVARVGKLDSALKNELHMARNA